MEKLLLLIDAVIVIAKEHANHVLNVVVIFLILLEIVDVLAVEMEWIMEDLLVTHVENHVVNAVKESSVNLFLNA